MPKKRYNAEEIIHKLRGANFLRVRRRISRTAFCRLLLRSCHFETLPGISDPV